MSISCLKNRNGVLFPEVIEVEVKFELPPWFPPERFDYKKVTKSYNTYITIDKTRYGNYAWDSLMNLKEVKNGCDNPMGPWIAISLSLNKNLYLQIGRFQAKLQRFLNRYNEAHGKPGRKRNVKRKYY